MSALWRKEDGGEEARIHASGVSTEGADEDCRSAENRPGQVTAAREVGVIDKRG